MVILHDILNTNALEFDWERFSEILRQLIISNSYLSRTPINADRWEEIIYKTLKQMNEKYNDLEEPKWILGSHAPGADVWIDKFSISAKSGNIKNNTLVISSYRLTRFRTLDEMIRFIDNAGKNFDIYLCCARIEKSDGSRIYQIYVIDSSLFSAANLEWSETPSGWEGIDNDREITVKIQKKMSNQLWMAIPLSLCNKILEVEINVKDLGSGT